MVPIVKGPRFRRRFNRETNIVHFFIAFTITYVKKVTSPNK